MLFRPMFILAGDWLQPIMKLGDTAFFKYIAEVGKMCLVNFLK